MIGEHTRVLKKERFKAFVDDLLKDHRVLAPRTRGEILRFETIDSFEDAVLDEGNTVNSPKEALFPQTERLFAYRQTKETLDIEEPSLTSKGFVLLGVRPCDARALRLLDKVFGAPVQDPYFRQRRAESLVVGMACTTPNPSCFCVAMGGGPCSAEGSDLLLIDLGSEYLVRAGSQKGATLLENEVFESASDSALDRGKGLEKKAEDAMKRSLPAPQMTGVGLEKLLEDLFDSPVWENISESCLGCGICTYLCPTCHCFDILDEAEQTIGERIRIWDSCQFSLFTQQASGVNPRPSGKERFRQRIMHKLCYLPKNGNIVGCVGCGRCVTECPVNLDIRETITRLSSLEDQ